MGLYFFIHSSTHSSSRIAYFQHDVVPWGQPGVAKGVLSTQGS